MPASKTPNYSVCTDFCSEPPEESLGMPSIPDVVTTIQAHPAPVVFLDTCVLLDIIRAPLRNIASTVQAATELLSGAQRTPQTVYPIIGCPTPKGSGTIISRSV